MTVNSDYSSNNKAVLIKAGKDYFDRLSLMIEQAKKCIHIQSYIFSEDETGKLFAEQLKKAALRNVDIYIMADGYASKGLSRNFINSLQSNKIQFRFFEPIFKSRDFYFVRRLHHKVIVVDSYSAMVSGINIADRYNDLPDKKAWLDFAVYIEGEAANLLCEKCRTIWNKYSYTKDAPPCNKFSAELEDSEKTDIRIRINDWVSHKNEISASYIEMLRNAKRHVTILCSYFLPGKVIRRLILGAVKRGVTVKVVAAGPSDVLLAKSAERWLYDWLIRNKVLLYEYKTNVLHGKIATCDDKWITIGSYNINNISAYASLELNVDIRNDLFSRNARLTIEDIISKECVQITKEIHLKKKNIFIQFGRWCSYQIIRVIFNLFTFYLKNNHKKD